LSVNNYL